MKKTLIIIVLSLWSAAAWSTDIPIPGVYVVRPATVSRNSENAHTRYNGPGI